jgi:hypothetical protein
MTHIQRKRLKQSIIASCATTFFLANIALVIVLGQGWSSDYSVRNTVCIPYAVIMTNGAADIRC